MFAAVYLLRREGEKLPRSHVVAIRGRLRITPGLVSGERGKDVCRSMTATVHTRWPQPFPGHAEATLHGAIITRMDERGFVLVGSEVVMNGLGANTYRQAWACVPLSGHDAGQLEPPSA